MGEHALCYDTGEVPLAKRTVECGGVKVRMEFYPGKSPSFCPVCGTPLADQEAGSQ